MLRDKRGYLILLLGVYIVVLVYFMFFGFGRLQLAENPEYRYSLIVTRIPLWFPKHFSIDSIKLWTFSLGNLLAFVPFGILVPLAVKNYFKTYFRFISLFVFFILCLEIVQMITYLGSFDLNDIIVNSMGATIGFCSYKISERMSTLRKKFISMGLSIVGLSLLMFLISWVFNNTITPYLEQ